jgi:hypothetical protein
VIWIVLIESAALLVLGMFVVALLHSYAGLAAKVDELSDRAPRRAHAGGRGRAAPEPTVRRDGPRAQQITGVTPSGDGVVLPLVGVERDTLVAFLSSTCTSCQHLWGELHDASGDVLPEHLRLLVVPKGPEHESPSAVLTLAPPGCDVVMSSEAWSDFKVPGSPYFVLVDGESGSVRGEGTATSWRRVIDLADVATGDARLAVGRDRRKPVGDLQREEEVDRALLDAGILPGDPSLYPTTPSPTHGHESMG